MLALALLLVSQPFPYIEAVIPVDTEPRTLCWVEPCGRLCCACLHDGRMAVVNGSNNVLERAFDVGAGPRDMYFDPVNDRLLLANRLDSTVMAIDPVSGIVTDTIRLNGTPAAFGHNLDQGRLYVALNDLDQVVVFLAAGLERFATIQTGNSPVAVVWNPAGDKIYVASEYGGTVQVFSGANHGLLATIPAGRLAMRAWLDHARNRLWVLNYESENFCVIDCSTDRWVDTVEVGHGPVDLAYWERGRALYVSNGTAGTLTRVDLGTSAATSFPAGYSPGAIAVDETNDWLFVCIEGENRVKVFDCRADTLVYVLEPGQLPVDIAWNPAHSRCYVANFFDNTLAVIRNPVGVAEGPRPVHPAGFSVRPALVGQGRQVSIAWENGIPARVLVRDRCGRTVAAPDGSLGHADWKAQDRHGRQVPPGVYFIEVRAPGCSGSAPVTLVD